MEPTNSRRYTVSRLCASGVALIGALTLAEYLFGLDLGIDQLIFRVTPTPLDLNPGRPAFVTALNFLLIGASLPFVGSKRWSRLAQTSVLVALWLSFLALVGYVQGAPSLYRVGAFSTVALHTTIALVILCLGVLFSSTESGWMVLAASDDAGGVVARLLLPAAIGLPLILGAVEQWAVQSGFYDNAFAQALSKVTTITILAFLIWRSASRLSRVDRQRGESEAALLRAHDELESRVQARTAEL